LGLDITDTLDNPYIGYQLMVRGKNPKEIDDGSRKGPEIKVGLFD